MAATSISGMSGTAMTTRPERPPAVRRLHPDDPPRVDRHEARTLDELQADRWLSYVEHREYGLLLQTAFYTGMRLGELLGLRWRDVDLEDGLIFVRQQYDRVARDFRDTRATVDDAVSRSRRSSLAGSGRRAKSTW